MSRIVATCFSAHYCFMCNNIFLNITLDPFLFSRSFLIWCTHQNYFWSWYLARSFCKRLCAASFPHRFCRWHYCSLYIVSFSCKVLFLCCLSSVPLNNFLTPISPFLCCRIPRWFPANALHPLHKLHTLEHHFLPLQEWALVLLSAFYFCERIFRLPYHAIPANLNLFSMSEFSSWHSVYLDNKKSDASLPLSYHYFALKSSDFLWFGVSVFKLVKQQSEK